MEKENITCFEDAVGYLYQVPKFTAKNSLEDTRKFLDILGSPDRKMKIIHVAGTNGKGSVCAYMQGILEEVGYTCAVFTSPHLVDIRERFRIKGEMVSKEAFFRAFLQIYDRIGDERLPAGYHPSFFEFLFLMAMVLFTTNEGVCVTDYVILETGLGGRLDATNSVSEKLLSVITQIGMDHMEYLGETVEEIAREKAGIIKTQVPVVFLENSTQVNRVIREKAKEMKSSCFSLSKKDYVFLNFKNKIIDFSYFSRYYGYVRLCIHTTALYQVQNASLAARAAELILDESRLTKEQIAAGVAKVQWAGRMEEVSSGIFADGAHNEDGVKAFLASAAQDECRGKRILIFSAVLDKQYEKMLALICESGLFGHIIVTKINNNRALSRQELMQAALKYPGISIDWQENSTEALQTAVKEKKESDCVYIAGSLYLVGEVKQTIGQGVSND